MNYIQQNTEIAHFMGHEPIEEKIYGFFINNKYKLLRKENFRYHSSWDWLMPVVEALENIGYSFNICYDFCDVGSSDGKILTTINGSSKIEAVYKAVCIFIEEYNRPYGN